MALLEYLYTDTMDFTPDIALELLSAADRFGLERLKRECITLIEAGLTTATVCHVLTIADRHSADDLKEVRAGPTTRARRTPPGAHEPSRAGPPRDPAGGRSA